MKPAGMKYTLGLFALLFLSTSAIYSQEQVLSFKEAVNIALKNNVALKKQNNQQFVNQAQKTSSMAQVAPSVSAFAQGWKVQGNQFLEQEARVVNDAETTNFYGTLDANMVLFNGFNNYNSIKQADANLEAQQYLVNRTRQDVITNVSNQYLRCLLDMELLEITVEDLSNQEKVLNQIKEMAKAGSLARVDEYNQEAIVKAAELTKLRAQIRLRGDKVILSQTLGREPDLEFQLVEPKWDLNRNNLGEKPIDQLYVQALNSRGDLLRAQKNVESTQKGKAISKTSFFPTLSIYGSLNSRYSDASLSQFNDQIDANQRKEYGLRLNVPIFSGMRNNSNYVQSKVNHSNAQLDLANQEIIVKSDVLNAHQSYRDAAVNFEASKAQLDAAELSFNLEQERYMLGISDFVASNQANQRFVQAKGDLAQATYTFMFQDILLQYATGTLRFEDIP